LCNTGEVIREKSKGNIYDNFVNFIKSYGEENPKIRGYAEDKEIFKVLNKTLKPNFQSKVEQYNSLVSMDSNVIDKMASEISKKLDIPQELIANAMERHQPTEMKDEETISTDRYYSPIWEFINDVYKDITESDNNESLKESDLTRIVKRVIQRKIWVPTNK
jgi:phage-related tail protein